MFKNNGGYKGKNNIKHEAKLNSVKGKSRERDKNVNVLLLIYKQ